MSSTREKILETLLSEKRCSINDLAEVVGINPISVRHHIIKLQADGLVNSVEERHGVGRPRRLYFLTDAGAEEFPTRYLKLTNRLLEQLKDSLPDNSLNELFARMGEDLAAKHDNGEDLTNYPMEKRLVVLKDLLEKEGFAIEWEKKGESYHIRELNCPYYHVGQQHPEVCAVDQKFISSVLSVPATKTKCILDGDNHCAYVVPKIAVSDVIAPDNP